MEVGLLGDLVVRVDGVPVDVRGSKQRVLLGMLAVHRHAVVGVDRLADAIWGESPPTNPVNALQAQVAQLRRTVGAAAIVTRPGGYALGPDVHVDLVEFEDLLARGRTQLEEGNAAGASRLIRDALTLRRGAALADFAYAEFAAAERARLEELLMLATEARIEADLALGRHRDVIGELDGLCDQHPLRERLWALRMTALYRAGRQADALRAYSEARAVLVDELGVEPGPELQRLESLILAQDPSLVAPRESSSARPERGNLPQTLNGFIGRADELQRLCGTVRGGRLVTVVGPGGVGKTRLAVELARALEERFASGAWIVELAGVAEGAGVAPAIAAALGVGDQSAARQATMPGSTIDAVAADLGERDLLLVLDNCEHVITESAAVVERLLASTSGVHVVATSREALGVPGEVLVPVTPLPMDDALQLLTERAKAVDPGFVVDDANHELALDLCRRLDGLPLAIELAAARLRALPLTQLGDRLQDRFRLLSGGARTSLPRHQTLRAVVDWSYELLFTDEQRLFRRLAVFAGGFTLADAEAVCSDDELAEVDVAESLFRLVDKSLVERVGELNGEARFSQLQTLWHFGKECLVASGEADALRLRHAAYFRHVAEDAREGLRGRTGPEWRRRLTANLDNLRAALDWHIDRVDADGALSLTSSMAWLWFLNGDFIEGVRWLGDALELSGATGAARAVARAWRGYMTGIINSHTASVAECEAAVAELDTSDDLVARGEVLNLLGSTLMRVRQPERALDVLETARDVFTRADHTWGLAAHDLIRALSLAALGRLEEAEESARSSIDRFEQTGEVWFVVEPVGTLAGIAEARGDLEAAATAYVDVLERSRVADQPSYVPLWCLRLASLRARQGDDAAADALYDDAIAASHSTTVTAEALVGRAAGARPRRDQDRPATLLDAAADKYDQLSSPSGAAAVVAGRVWLAIAAGDTDAVAACAQRAAEAQRQATDRTAELLVDAAVAAAALVSDRSPEHRDAFLQLAAQRRATPVFGGLVDSPDIAALADSLVPTSH